LHEEKREKSVQLFMPARDIAEDASFLLYFVPIVVSIVYGAYEWSVVSHTSSTMPVLSYLVVSKSPILYIVSIVAVCAALIIDVSSTPSAERTVVMSANASRMQILSVVVLLVSLAGALSVANYNLANGFSFFIAGRYALIYALSILGLSILLVPRQMLGTARASSYAEILGLLLMGASPVVLYAAYKVHLGFGISAIGAIVVAILGGYLFFNNTRLFGKRPERAPASPTSLQNPSPQKSAPPQATA
jgi:hypothetical protein